jgi:hypothetical protein
MIRQVLQGDTVLIRATFEYLIDIYMTRSYMPGLLRLLTRSLAVRDEWTLLKYLLTRAMHQKDPFLGNRNVAAIVNYAMSLSTRLGKGQKEVTAGKFRLKCSLKLQCIDLLGNEEEKNGNIKHGKERLSTEQRNSPVQCHT